MCGQSKSWSRVTSSLTRFNRYPRASLLARRAQLLIDSRGTYIRSVKWSTFIKGNTTKGAGTVNCPSEIVIAFFFYSNDLPYCIRVSTFTSITKLLTRPKIALKVHALKRRVQVSRRMTQKSRGDASVGENSLCCGKVN